MTTDEEKNEKNSENEEIRKKRIKEATERIGVHCNDQEVEELSKKMKDSMELIERTENYYKNYPKEIKNLEEIMRARLQAEGRALGKGMPSVLGRGSLFSIKNEEVNALLKFLRGFVEQVKVHVNLLVKSRTDVTVGTIKLQRDVAKLQNEMATLHQENQDLRKEIAELKKSNG